MLLLYIFLNPLDALHNRGVFSADHRVLNENSRRVPLVHAQLPIKDVIFEVVVEADPLHVRVALALSQLFKGKCD